jgi:hypothetical protein
LITAVFLFNIFTRNKMRTYMYVVACVEFLLEAALHWLV